MVPVLPPWLFSDHVLRSHKTVLEPHLGAGPLVQILRQVLRAQSYLWVLRAHMCLFQKLH